MFAYNVKLAIKSMRRNPMMTTLMVAAIAVGIGISMTTLSVYYMMNGNLRRDAGQLGPDSAV